MQEGQKEGAPPSNHLQSEPNASLLQKDAFALNASFHVRISIGYMTGLKVDKIVKHTKQPANNRITVGFIELASSGKYTALSQPLLTNIYEKVKTTKILWANRQDGDEIFKSRSRLHFSLLLERESIGLDSCDDSDDNSASSRSSFVPEVLKLHVGLKFGDERIPLGIAKFAVNGSEKSEKKMDLIVLPVSGLSSGSKTKRAMFGKKPRNSFTNGELAFKLIPNKKLRIKTEVKIGYPGQDGAEIWGDDKSSNTSATGWAFDSEAQFSPRNGPSPTHGLSFSTIKIPPVKGGVRINPSKTYFNFDNSHNSMHL